ncbi:hypothetical protein BDR04DRAFT_1150791 [Suillus decipiens]|nr:hypothetical protein BDR04DRAFT_1150791 [Suillus decipiens]
MAGGSFNVMQPTNLFIPHKSHLPEHNTPPHVPLLPGLNVPATHVIPPTPTNANNTQGGPSGASVVGQRSEDANTAMEKQFNLINCTIDELVVLTGMSMQQILNLFLKSCGCINNITNHWNIYRQYFKAHCLHELWRAGKDVNVISECYRSFQDAYPDDWQDILDTFNKTQIASGLPLTVTQQSQEFTRLTKKVTSLLDLATTKHGFEAALLMCRKAMNQDASIGYIHTTSGAEEFLASHCCANEDTMVGHFQAHASLAVIEDIYGEAEEDDEVQEVPNNLDWKTLADHIQCIKVGMTSMFNALQSGRLTIEQQKMGDLNKTSPIIFGEAPPEESMHAHSYHMLVDGTINHEGLACLEPSAAGTNVQKLLTCKEAASHCHASPKLIPIVELHKHPPPHPLKATGKKTSTPAAREVTPIDMSSTQASSESDTEDELKEDQDPVVGDNLEYDDEVTTFFIEPSCDERKEVKGKGKATNWGTGKGQKTAKKVCYHSVTAESDLGQEKMPEIEPLRFCGAPEQPLKAPIKCKHYKPKKIVPGSEEAAHQAAVYIKGMRGTNAMNDGGSGINGSSDTNGSSDANGSSDLAMQLMLRPVQARLPGPCGIQEWVLPLPPLSSDSIDTMSHVHAVSQFQVSQNCHYPQADQHHIELIHYYQHGNQPGQHHEQIDYQYVSNNQPQYRQDMMYTQHPTPYAAQSEAYEGRAGGYHGAIGPSGASEASYQDSRSYRNNTRPIYPQDAVSCQESHYPIHADNALNLPYSSSPAPSEDSYMSGAPY